MTDVRYFRLITGEDIIAEIITETTYKTQGTIYRIRNPLKIIYMPSVREKGSIMMSFSSWVYRSIVDEQSFDLSSNNVLLCGEIDDTVTEHYFKSVGQILDKQTKASETELRPDDLDFDKLGRAFEQLANMLEKEGIIPPDPDSPDEQEAKDFVEDWFKKASANNNGGKLH